MIKHKVVQDYQFVTSDKKIVVLKSGTILENHTYLNKSNNEKIKIDRDIIDNNTSFFKPVDWKEELNSHLKSNKIPQPSSVCKKLIPFIEEMFILNQKEDNDSDELENEILLLKSQLDTKSKEILLKETQLSNKEYDLSLKESEIKNKEIELSLKEVEIKNKEIEVSLKEEQLKHTQMSDSELDVKIEELNSKEQELLSKNFELEKKLSEILLKESELNSHLKSLDEKEESLNKYESVVLSKLSNLIEEQKNAGYDVSFIKDIVKKL